MIIFIHEHGIHIGQTTTRFHNKMLVNGRRFRQTMMKISQTANMCENVVVVEEGGMVITRWASLSLRQGENDSDVG